MKQEKNSCFGRKTENNSDSQDNFSSNLSKQFHIAFANTFCYFKVTFKVAQENFFKSIYKLILN